MNTLRLIAAACFFCLVVAGCSFFFLENTDVHIDVRTDQNSYVVDSVATIQLSITNDSEESVYYYCVDQVFLEKVDKEFVLASWPVFAREECLGPLPHEVGVTRTVTFPFAESQKNVPRPRGAALGTLEGIRFDEKVEYRFRYQVYADREAEQAIREGVFSNRFTITQ